MVLAAASLAVGLALGAFSAGAITFAAQVDPARLQLAITLTVGLPAAGVLFVLGWAAASGRVTRREQRRRLALRCTGCNYDLRGIAEGAACPDCGTPARGGRSGNDKVCPHCRTDLSARVAGRYHAGMSDVLCLWCIRCYGNVLISFYDPAAAPFMGLTDSEELMRIEPMLRRCVCGGDYKLYASPRCPACNERIDELFPSRDFYGAPAHYWVTDRTVDGSAGGAVWNM